MVVASMATKGDRDHTDTVVSIIDQVDDFHSYLGSEFPGDANKFRGLIGHEDAYLLSIDDDIIYPPDYVEYMLRKVDEYKRNAVITLHGKQLLGQPEDFYTMPCRKFRCLQGVSEETRLHIPGTGVMAWHSSLTPDLSLSEFHKSNMADVLFGAYCEEKGIDRVVAAHTPGWIKGVSNERTIYQENMDRKDELSEVLQETEWKC